MIKSLPAPIRALSNTQRLLLLILSLVVAFLILGTISQRTTTESSIFGIQKQPFVVLAFLSFAGGLLSFISPCTLPVLTAYFAFAFQSERTRIAANTLAFMLGLATTFSILGAASFVLGQVILQNQQLILLIGGAFILVFGVMSLLGQGFSGAETMSNQEHSATLGGSYLFGLTFAVGWSSCVGPILGSVLTLAGQANTVWQGMMLLFIYTLGLGLPLMVVSTLFGRASRQSFFWRVLRGKGWDWDTHVLVVAVVWGLAIWRVLVAVAEYALTHFFATRSHVSSVQEWGLLVIALMGAVLWVMTSSQAKQVTIRLHTTQLISGALFIIMGLLLLEGRLTLFNNLIPTWLTEWLGRQEDWLIRLFN